MSSDCADLMLLDLIQTSDAGVSLWHTNHSWKREEGFCREQWGSAALCIAGSTVINCTVAVYTQFLNDKRGVLCLVTTEIPSETEMFFIWTFKVWSPIIQIPDECESCVPWFLEVPEHQCIICFTVAADKLHSISISAEEIRGSLVDLHSLTHTWTDRENILPPQDTQEKTSLFFLLYKNYSHLAYLNSNYSEYSRTFTSRNE